MSHSVQLLSLVHLDPLIEHITIIVSQSGRDGDPIHNPYPRDHVFDSDRARQVRTEGWPRAIDEPDWKRSWGVWVQDTIIGHVELHGGKLASESHRCKLGIGIERRHRSQGRGRALMNACIQWARAQPELAWIDLGVFVNNPRAAALYEQLGFERVGQIRDRFRVDGQSISDISMTLAV